MQLSFSPTRDLRMISLINVYNVQNYSFNKSNQIKSRCVIYPSSQDHKEKKICDFSLKVIYLHDLKQLCGDNISTVRIGYFCAQCYCPLHDGSKNFQF